MIKQQSKLNTEFEDASTKAKKFVRIIPRICTGKKQEYLLVIADMPIRPYLTLDEANKVKSYMQKVIRKIIIETRKK